MNLENFKVSPTKTAQKDLLDIPPKTRLVLLKAIKNLEVSPFPKGNIIKKLKGIKGSIYRLRVGDFRAVYYLDIDKKEISILFVVNRKDLEKKLKSL